VLDRVWGGHRHLSVSVPGSLEALVEQLLAGVTELETTQAQRDRVIAAQVDRIAELERIRNSPQVRQALPFTQTWRGGITHRPLGRIRSVRRSSSSMS
jgi:hypothetical protein